MDKMKRETVKSYTAQDLNANAFTSETAKNWKQKLSGQPEEK